MGLFKKKENTFSDEIFIETKKIGRLISVDEENRKFYVNGDKKNIYSFDSVVEYELIEDEETIIKGNAGKAIAGGILFGGIGAIAGASSKRKTKNVCKSMIVKVSLNNGKNVCMFMIAFKTEINGAIYQMAVKNAKEILSIFDNFAKHEEEKISTIQIDKYEEVKKLKELLDLDIISQDEYENKKNKLLDL